MLVSNGRGFNATVSVADTILLACIEGECVRLALIDKLIVSS